MLLEVSFAALVSISVRVTAATFVICVALVLTLPGMVMVAVAPRVSEPSAQVMTPAFTSHVPCDAEAGPV